MTDLAERLRELIGQTDAFANNRHHSFVTTQQMARESAAALKEAADEIERLLEALDRLTTQRRQDIGQLRAENERLQAALSKAIDELSYADLRASGGIAEAP